MSGVDETREAISKALDKKHMSPGKVRPIDKNILWMSMVGASDEEIAKEIGVTRYVITNKLRNPIIQREMERLSKVVDKEIVGLTIASKKRMNEASLTAADALVSMIETAPNFNDKLKAIIKVLEYTHGKPRQSVAISVDDGKPLSEDDEKIIDVMIDSDKDG
ncbi:hypothetical protein LCGC14_0611190 [marine sediment metagenome]|uniref:Uncharacterized protein n=1 Tax=marine sediment metagenome TaxID=412755 RepID=A0A0F9RRV0_9ZZZZ